MIKKTVLAGLISLASMSAQADTLLGVYAGASYWDANASGNFGSKHNFAEFDLADESKNSYWVALEHFVPFVPNFKLRHNELDTPGAAEFENIELFGKTFTGLVELNTELDHTDLIFYYEILDNSLVSVDLGLNLKYADYIVNYTGTLLGDSANPLVRASSSEHYDGVIPMLYTMVDLGIPGTDVNLFVDASYIVWDGDKAYDVQGGIKYRLVDNMAVDLDLQLGYRAIKVDVEDLSGLYIDAEWDGAFAGLEVHF